MNAHSHRTHEAIAGAVRLFALAFAAVVPLFLARPASALLEPRPHPQWRAGFMWSLNEPDVIGLDWGVGVRLPLQPSELGVATLSGSLQGTLSNHYEWDFRLAGLLESYRTGRPTLGVYYTLRHFPDTVIPWSGQRALNGIGFRYGSLATAFYPELWNSRLETDRLGPVVVVEPGWFSGLYVQLRWLFRPKAQASSVRLAVGLEEDW